MGLRDRQRAYQENRAQQARQNRIEQLGQQLRFERLEHDRLQDRVKKIEATTLPSEPVPVGDGV